MKSIFNLSKGILSVALISVAFASCSEDTMDRINEDKDHTTSVPAKFILADVITATAFSNIGGDFNTYYSTYVEHMVGVDNQLANAEKRNGEPSASSTFNNVWGNLYSTLKNARIAINISSDELKGNYTTKGIAEVLAAINAGLIADSFGDTPFSQAALPELVNGQPQFLTPELDKQEVIYTSIMEYLDAAIADLPKGDKSDKIKDYDFIYKGDGEAWLKLAYGLKARYTMHLLARSSSKEVDLQKILEYVSKSYTSIKDQAAFSIYDANNINPLFDFQWSRDGLAASKSFADKLIERNDPRLRRIFCIGQGMRTEEEQKKKILSVQITGADDPRFLMADNGTAESVKYKYNTPIFVYSQTCPTLLMSYHELLFLKAEALARLNKKNEAANALKEAIAAAIANAEIGVKAAFDAPTVASNRYNIKETTEAITATEAEEYFTNNVKPLFDANPVKEVMVQKYIAFLGAFGETTECYNDVRRLKAMGEEYIKLDNPYKFPLRAPYGADDVSANPNVESAFGNGQYVYTDPVWWAGGSR
ncbi:SusD/RagB family nutrient-binding outer membrane lipoprotein [Bacteroides fragilis]|uniref:SusD/RagB family nutrient-binding outer membrane lipoprotein n=1 Tax=Bacteroides fragilis TaxID=817 RepID=UPI001879D412|nr:SusD/RagB family nutrient-binding outer membrane lipoprotein [Bacteroides fragilis]MBE7398259.1 SusD/RagB family nutrient-binding outer membrane lipoprotein [Bacteroides fragilis]